MKMINSSAFQIRLFNCHLAYASKKKNSILQPPLIIKNKKDEGKIQGGCTVEGTQQPRCRLLQGKGDSNKWEQVFPNRFWRLPIYLIFL